MCGFFFISNKLMICVKKIINKCLVHNLKTNKESQLTNQVFLTF